MENANELTERLLKMAEETDLQGFEALGDLLQAKGLETGEPSNFNDAWNLYNVYGAPEGTLERIRRELPEELRKLGYE